MVYLVCKDESVSQFVKYEVLQVMIPFKDDIYFKVAGVETREGKKITPALRSTLNLPTDMYKSTAIFFREVVFVIVNSFFKNVILFKYSNTIHSLPHRTKEGRRPRLDD
jgi:hypothetical protein